MLVPVRKNVKAWERGRVDGGEKKLIRIAGRGYLRKGGAKLLFFRHGIMGFIDDPLAEAGAVGRLTSPMAYSRLRKSYFWVPSR